MRRWLPLTVALIGCSQGREGHARRDHESARGQRANLVDVGVGAELLVRCPLRGFVFDGLMRGFVVDTCGETLLTTDGGASFSPVVADQVPRSMLELYRRAVVSPDEDAIIRGTFYGIRADSLIVTGTDARFASFVSPSTSARPLRRTGGGPWESIRDTWSIAPRSLCTYGPLCGLRGLRAGRTEHAIVLSVDDGATWHVIARSTGGVIRSARVVDHAFLVLVGEEVMRIIGGELITSAQPELDRYDFFNTASRPPSPTSCLRRAAHGVVWVSAHVQGCFGGPRHEARLRWTPVSSNLDIAAGTRVLPDDRRLEALEALDEVLSRREGAGYASTSSTYASLEWECDGVRQKASFASSGSADKDEEPTRRALALFQWAERLQAR